MPTKVNKRQECWLLLLLPQSESYHQISLLQVLTIYSPFNQIWKYLLPYTFAYTILITLFSLCQLGTQKLYFTVVSIFTSLSISELIFLHV